MTKAFTVIVFAALLCIARPVLSQDAELGSFDDIEIKWADNLSLNFKSKNVVDKLSGNVSLLMKGEKPEENMEVKADAIEFNYEGAEDGTPTSLTLTGDVTIKNAEMMIKSPKAILNTKTNQAEFIGESEIHMEGKAPIVANNITVNMDTGDAQLSDVRSVSKD